MSQKRIAHGLKEEVEDEIDWSQHQKKGTGDKR